jgi:hypothetical protein
VRHQVAQNLVVGAYLIWIAPAVDQVRRFIKRGIDQMRCALQFRCGIGTLGCYGKVDRHMARAIELARLAPRQRHDLASIQCAEVPQGGVSHQPGRAGDHYLLVGHFQLRCDYLLKLANDDRRRSLPS